VTYDFLFERGINHFEFKLDYNVFNHLEGDAFQLLQRFLDQCFKNVDKELSADKIMKDMGLKKESEYYVKDGKLVEDEETVETLLYKLD
jgi:hypothetical protein